MLQRRSIWFYWALLMLLAVSPRASGNVWSRYLTIESLIERNELAVDRSPLLAASGTPDLVMFDGRLYSDKPPVLSVLAAAVYAPLSWAGVTLAGSFVAVNWVLVATFACGAAALTLMALRRLFQTLPLTAADADTLTLGFGAASLLLPYALTFNNHIVGAALITLAFAIVHLEPGLPASGWWRRAAGASAGLASVIDLPAGGAMLMALGGWLWWRGAVPWSYIAGAGVPLLLHAGLQSMVTGSPIPAEAYPEAFMYPGSYWTTPAAAIRATPRWQFGLEFMLGPAGWLTMTPVLAVGLVGLTTIALRPGDPLRPAAIVVGVATSVVIVYYVFLTRRTDFAGQSYGTRHMLAVSAPVYFFAVAVWSRTHRRAVKTVFLVLMVVGGIYAAFGAYDPWVRVEGRRDWLLLSLQRFVPYPWSSYAR